MGDVLRVNTNRSVTEYDEVKLVVLGQDSRRPRRVLAKALLQPTAREVAEAMVHGAAEATSGDTHGCVLVGNANGLAEFRESAVRDLARRFDEVVGAGELSDVDTLLLARLDSCGVPRDFDSSAQWCGSRRIARARRFGPGGVAEALGCVP